MKYLLLLALLPGCYSEGPVFVDERFTAEERGEIEHGISLWPIRTELVWDSHVSAFDTDMRRTIVRVDVETLEIADPGATERGVRGYAAGIVAQHLLILPLRNKLTPMWHVVAHEFGHNLGLDHVDDPRALMYQTRISGVTQSCIGESDAAEYYRVNGVRIRTGCAE